MASVDTYSFGEWLRQRRKELRLTQQGLADATFCSRTMIKKIESDERRPSEELAQLLAHTILIPDDQLKIFIECARGLRPVDDLTGQPEPGWEQAIVAAGITPAPLPLAATPLIGRHTELEGLAHLLSSSWLVTLIGPGGVGKTRLALAAAAAWQKKGHQAVFVSLAELNEAAYIVAAINKVIGLHQSPRTDPKEQLIRYLRQKEMLIVLDNFEHLLDGVDLLVQLRQASPGLTLLTTSRLRLNLPGEQLFPLEGLSYPEEVSQIEETAEFQRSSFPAIQLFLDSAHRLLPDYEPHESEAILELCRITQGLPLALELAAAWVDTLPLSELVGEMRQNLDILTQEQPQRPARHHSIRAVFDTTWKLLSDYEQQAFARTAVFRGGFTRQAAAVVGVNLPSLSSLTGRHLIRLDLENGRYTTHELMRQYALEKLEEFGELENGRQIHFYYYLEQARSLADKLHGPDQHDTLILLDAEQGNFRAALRWSLAAALLDSARLALALCWYWRIRNRVYEARRWLLELLAVDIEDTGLAAALNFHAGHIAWMQGDFSTARKYQQVSERLWRSLGDDGLNGLAYTLNALGMVANQEGKLDEAQHYFETSLVLFEQCQDKWGAAFTQSGLGLNSIKLGKLSSAHELLAQSLSGHRQIGDEWAKGLTLTQFAYLEWELDHWDEAYNFAEEASKISGKLGSWHSLGVAWELMAQIAQQQGDLVKARKLYQDTLKLYTDMGNDLIAVEVQGRLNALLWEG